MNSARSGRTRRPIGSMNECGGDYREQIVLGRGVYEYLGCARPLQLAAGFDQDQRRFLVVMLGDALCMPDDVFDLLAQEIVFAAIGPECFDFFVCKPPVFELVQRFSLDL